MLYSFNNQYPTELPNRLRLSNGLTKTDPATFTESEILEAGYIPVEIPAYNHETQYLEWTGLEFIVKNKPPQPNWDNFNSQMLNDPRFNQVSIQCFSYAPMVASSVPTALLQVSTHGISSFTQIWTKFCAIGEATEEDKVVWGEYAIENNLPQEFIDILRG